MYRIIKHDSSAYWFIYIPDTKKAACGFADGDYYYTIYII